MKSERMYKKLKIIIITLTILLCGSLLLTIPILLSGFEQQLIHYTFITSIVMVGFYIYLYNLPLKIYNYIEGE